MVRNCGTDLRSIIFFKKIKKQSLGLQKVVFTGKEKTYLNSHQVWIKGCIKKMFFNYATKTDIKEATRVDTSEFQKKVDFINLKSEIDNVI